MVMSDKIKLAVLGGDTRQYALIERFLANGLLTYTFGLPTKALPPGAVPVQDWREATDGARAVILPLPASPDGVRVHMPLMPEAEAPPLSMLFRELPLHIPVAGGRFSPTVRALAEQLGRPLFDYFASEELQQKNALPTAEGAVFIAMRELPYVISGMPVAVTGYGRVARALCELLSAMHADVTVAARKPFDLANAAAHGYRTVSIAQKDGVMALCQGQRVIFNTVPFWLFSGDVLARMQKDTLIIDLASAPGGVDAEAAKKCGVRVIWALSLPGKYAPASAGEYVADTVLSYLTREGII